MAGIKQTLLRRGTAFVSVGVLAASVLAYGAYAVVGWLGVGAVGLLIAFVAFQAEMDGDGPIGSQQSADLFAASQAARDRMTRSERAAERAEKTSSLQAITVAKAIGIVLALAGLAGFFALQMPR